ncbi:MAG: fimbrillin family protein [Muribaculaceae bacterium]|nr:fimbrillin family protein [Muribaculaceae bacterium]
MKKIYLLATAVAITLAACDKNEDNPQSAYQAAKITAKIADINATRAINTSWEAGDAIGIHSIVGRDGENRVIGPYFNVEYTTVKGDGIFTGDSLYFYKPMTLYAYYPFAKTGDANGIDDNGIIKANTRTDNQRVKEQRLIDFLWASENGFTARNPKVDFTFTHQMSQLTFKFLNTSVGDPLHEVLVENITAYELIGLGFDGSFNTYTGVCAINDPAVNDSIKIEKFKDGSTPFYKNIKHDEFLDPIIMFPQKPGNDKVLLRLYLDELKGENHEHQLQTYTCTLTFGDGELKPGCNYKYTIRVSKVGLIVGEMSIEPWKVERDVKLTSTIDGGFVEWEDD